jgi:hypothetical protein
MSEFLGLLHSVLFLILAIHFNRQLAQRAAKAKAK